MRVLIVEDALTAGAVTGAVVLAGVEAVFCAAGLTGPVALLTVDVEAVGGPAAVMPLTPVRNAAVDRLSARMARAMRWAMRGPMA